MRSVEVTWDQVAERFVASGSIVGHDITINAPAMPGEQRRPTGFSAADLLLAAMGSCSAWDVVEIVRKSRQEVADLSVTVTAEQEPDPPWTFRSVHLRFTFRGEAVDPVIAHRAVRLSVDRYCSVIATVRGSAEVTDSIEIIGEATVPTD